MYFTTLRYYLEHEEGLYRLYGYADEEGEFPYVVWDNPSRTAKELADLLPDSELDQSVFIASDEIRPGTGAKFWATLTDPSVAVPRTIYAARELGTPTGTYLWPATPLFQHYPIGQSADVAAMNAF